MKFVCNATSQNDWQQVLNIANDKIVPCIGIHPWYLSSASEDWESQMRELVRRPNVHVGEIGLDNYKVKISPKPLQEEFFRKQLQIAKDFGKVANVHCVSAYGKLVKVVKDGRFDRDLKILMHSWEGPWNITEELLTLLGGNVVFSLSMVSLGKEKHLDVVRRLPLENVLIETDSPSQAMMEFVKDEEDLELINGKVMNKPWYLKHVFHKLAQIKEINEEDLNQSLLNNFNRLFS